MFQEKKTKVVYDLFESIADHYDKMNSILSFGQHKAWRKLSLKKMRVQPGDMAIDVCCGTCDWTISLAQKSKNGKIVGLDFSPNMLAVGKEKVKSFQLEEQIQLIQGDAMRIPFPENMFDHATIGFALRNVADFKQVLLEMKRVVKPGGQIASLELSKPTYPVFNKIYYFYFQRLVPLLGEFLIKRYKQYEWLPKSLIDFPGYKELGQIMNEDIGLKDIQIYPLTGGIAALHMGCK